MAGLLAAFLIGAPLVAFVAGHWAYQAGLGAEHAKQAALHQVPAVLLASTPQALPKAPLLPMAVRARWAVPGHGLRTGMVTVPAGARAGSTVLVWIDAAGRLSAPPVLHSAVEAHAFLAAGSAVVALGVVLLCAGGLVRRAVKKCRMAAWDTDWQATGPQWTRGR